MSRNARVLQVIGLRPNGVREVVQETLKTGVTLTKHVARYLSYQMAVRR
jgi:hypothetical protein